MKGQMKSEKTLNDKYLDLLKFLVDVDYDGRVIIKKQNIQKIFVNKIADFFQQKITFDNTIANIIIEKLDSIQYMKVEMNNKEMEKADKLRKVGQLLREIKYISHIKMMVILKKSSPQNSLEFRIRKLLQANIDPDQTSVLYQEWEKDVQIDFKLFWRQIFYERKLYFLPVIKHLYKNCKSLLYLRIQKYQVQRISKKIYRDLLEVEEILNEVASEKYLHSNHLKAEMIEQELTQIQNSIKPQLSKILNNNQINFQIYGSYRTNVSLVDSDLDICVFVKNNTNYSPKQFSIFVLKQIVDILIKIDKGSHIKQVKPILTDEVRVPVVMFQFKKRHIKKLDIVVNNKSGVQSSRFMYRYSLDIFIRNLLILAKAWAKQNELIERRKFSSHGICYMMLYYLMKKDILSFRKQENSKEAFKKKKDFIKLSQAFKGFLEFYSRGAQFFTKNQTVCLLQECNLHEETNSQYFLVNMHDAFEKSHNPGRFQKKESNDFFLAVDKTKLALESGSYKIIRFVFGLQQ